MQTPLHSWGGQGGGDKWIRRGREQQPNSLFWLNLKCLSKRNVQLLSITKGKWSSLQWHIKSKGMAFLPQISTKSNLMQHRIKRRKCCFGNTLILWWSETSYDKKKLTIRSRMCPFLHLFYAVFSQRPVCIWSVPQVCLQKCPDVVFACGLLDWAQSQDPSFAWRVRHTDKRKNAYGCVMHQHD